MGHQYAKERYYCSNVVRLVVDETSLQICDLLGYNTCYVFFLWYTTIIASPRAVICSRTILFGLSWYVFLGWIQLITFERSSDTITPPDGSFVFVVCLYNTSISQLSKARNVLSRSFECYICGKVVLYRKTMFVLCSKHFHFVFGLYHVTDISNQY